MKNLAIFLGLAIAVFVTAQMAQAIQIIDDTLQVNSLKVGVQGVGGVTFFNGTIINETTTDGANNPVTFGDNVRIDGRLYRGATSGTSDSLPFLINDNVEVSGSLTTASLTTDSINLTVLDNLGCQEGDMAYYGTGGWECSADLSTSLLLFIDCLNTQIAGETNITVADWEYCYNLFL